MLAAANRPEQLAARIRVAVTTAEVRECFL